MIYIFFNLLYHFEPFEGWSIMSLCPNTLSISFLRTRTFSCIATVQWSKSRNVTFTQYYNLIHRTYSIFNSCFNNVHYNYFFLVQNPILNHTLHLLSPLFPLIWESCSTFLFWKWRGSYSCQMSLNLSLYDFYS